MIIDFGSSGIRVMINGRSWSKFHPSNSYSMVTGDMDSSGQDEAYIDFGTSEMYPSEAAMDTMIKSVKSSATGAVVEEVG